MLQKKQVRKNFRDSVFKRDKYRCRGCGKLFPHNSIEEYLDAHHVTPREEMPNGGYVKENGISLCKSECHMKAEMWIKNESGEEGFDPRTLYNKIGSSKESATRASEKL